MTNSNTPTDAGGLVELALACERATGPSDALDLSIAEWCYSNGAVAGVNYDPRMWIERNGGEFTRSLDAAMTLYVTVPARIPSNPRAATAEALRQRASAHA